MISMPESYDEYCRKKGTLAETIYNLPQHPHHMASWYEEANLTLHSMCRGVFYIYYVLRSFPRPADDRRYNLMVITKQGIFVSVNTLCFKDEPLDFTTLMLKRWTYFGHGDFITLKPNTREIILLRNYTYTEIVNGKSYSNRWYFFDHKHEFKDIKSHNILMESDTHDPIMLDWNADMYEHIRLNKPYIWLGEDNYVSIKDVRFNRQPY